MAKLYVAPTQTPLTTQQQAALDLIPAQNIAAAYNVTIPQAQQIIAEENAKVQADVAAQQAVQQAAQITAQQSIDTANAGTSPSQNTVATLSSDQAAKLNNAVTNGFYSAEQLAAIKTAVDNGTMPQTQLNGIVNQAVVNNAATVKAPDLTNTTGGNINTDGNINTNANVNTGNLNTGGTSTLTGASGNDVVNTGNVNTGNLNTSGTSTLTGASGNDVVKTGTTPSGLTLADLQGLGYLTKSQYDTGNTAFQTDLLKNLGTQNTQFQTDLLKNLGTQNTEWGNTLKSDILRGVDTKNQQFGQQATQGFMSAFKNFQIPTNQQTGVNMGNYNDNRNAAADQWWSQYVTGRR